MMNTAVSQHKKPFFYRGKNNLGEAVSGVFYCFNEQRAKIRLKKQKVLLSLIYEKQLPTLFSNNKIKTTDVTTFMRQLSTMVDASLPLIEGLRAVKESSTHVGIKNMLTVMILKIEEGHTLSDAMGLFPNQFDHMTVHLVKMGAESGILPQVLSRLADQQEQQRTRRAKLKRAMIYPITMLLSEIILLAIMLLFVVPPLENMYANLNTELPTITSAVVGMSNWLTEYWLWLLAGVLLVTFSVKQAFKKSPIVRHGFQRLLLKMAVVKGVVSASATSQLMHSLSIQIRAGIPLLQSLRGSTGCTGNIVYDDATETMANDVERGHQLSDSMRQLKLFPEVLIQMTRTGERTGDVVIMVDRAVKQIDTDVEQKLDGLSSLFEMVLVVSLSVSIGIMVVAMYLPIFKMGGIV